PISIDESAKGASQSTSGQYRDSSGKYAAVNGNTEREGQYVTQGWGVSLLREGKYQAAKDSCAGRGDIPGARTCGQKHVYGGGFFFGVVSGRCGAHFGIWHDGWGSDKVW